MHINAHSQELTHTVAILFLRVQVYVYVFGCFATFMLFFDRDLPIPHILAAFDQR